jgi:hypothetical protein
MNNNSTNKLVISVLIALMVGLVALFAFQSLWLKLIQNMLNASGAFDVSSDVTPVSGLSFATAPAPVGLNVEAKINHMAISVTRVVVPANLAGYASFSTIEQDEQYLWVEINVRCLASATESCRLTEYDFGVRGKSGADYPAELSSWFDVNGLFEGGEIKPGKSMSGAMIFVVKKGDSRLTLSYPRMFAFEDEAKFILTK